MSKGFRQLLTDVRGCEECAHAIDVRPVLQFHPSAKILIAGQAPGRKVHESGVPFDDASGNRLRDWLGIDRATFYDERQMAILPMGFCYPGTGKSGDHPPRPECAPLWREPLLSKLKDLQLTLIIGQYALAWHLPEAKGSLTEQVQAQPGEHNGIFILPHPSPRNNIWLKKNPWFEAEHLPILRGKVAEVLLG